MVQTYYGFYPLLMPTPAVIGAGFRVGPSPIYDKSILLAASKLASRGLTDRDAEFDTARLVTGGVLSVN